MAHIIDPNATTAEVLAALKARGEAARAAEEARWEEHQRVTKALMVQGWIDEGWDPVLGFPEDRA